MLTAIIVFLAIGVLLAPAALVVMCACMAASKRDQQDERKARGENE